MWLPALTIVGMFRLRWEDVAVLPSHLSSAQHDNNGRVAVNSVASRCHRREQQLLRAPPGRAQHLGSLDRDTFSHDVALYLEEEGAERVVEVRGEGTAVRSAVMT